MEVLEYRVLRRTFGTKRVEGREGWKTLHNEKRHYIYFSSDVIRVIKQEGFESGEYVAWDRRKMHTKLRKKLE
jgi:hypothetical protein